MPHSAFDLISVCTLVAFAAGYLGFLLFKRLHAGKNSGGCGGGCSCPLKKPEAALGRPARKANR